MASRMERVLDRLKEGVQIGPKGVQIGHGGTLHVNISKIRKER